MDKDLLAAMVGFLLFFGAMFGLFAYGATLQHECRMHALEKGLPASEILAVCK
jgi:hypothetical protein